MSRTSEGIDALWASLEAILLDLRVWASAGPRRGDTGTIAEGPDTVPVRVTADVPEGGDIDELEQRVKELEERLERDEVLGDFVMPPPKAVDRLVSVKGLVAKIRRRADRLQKLLVIALEGSYDKRANMLAGSVDALREIAWEIENGTF